MGKQLIISLGREFGSGGHVIAQKLSEHYQIPLYDYNLLRDIKIERNLYIEDLEKYDECPRNPFLTRTVRGYSSSPEVNIAMMQFECLRQKAASGESFVIVGRCAETILKDNPNMISIFVIGDMEQKIARTMERNNISREKAVKMIALHDRKRKAYHNHFCDHKWGDSRNYELCINSSRVGLDETTRIIIDYIDSRQKV
ncbi:MAG: cytidylate kinase-like family protein [Eubacterium sp.]|nr:cytidylate kinase-like family protein [Eubacterium sp.]MDY4742332.1 cytidylate kinase-like family protein [Lachnospira sp.]